MPLRCRHVIKKQSSLYDQDKLQKYSPIHLTNSALVSEQEQFKPWSPIESHRNHQYSSDHQSLHRTSLPPPSNTSYFTRNYGWDEIEQNQDETKRLRQLLSIWDAERIAILKLQHDLDKNIFQRTFDYIKRMGQSIGLALWLWVHRPANCSNINNLYQQQRTTCSLIDGDKSQQLICTPCLDTRNHSKLHRSDDRERQDCSIPSIDSLPDSIWLKHFVLDETEECLPPIARAMKNLLDHNALIWNSRNKEEEEKNLWPHFINENKRGKNKIFQSNTHSEKSRQSSSKYKTNKKIPKIEVTDIDTKDQYSTTKMNTSRKQHSKKSSRRKRSKSKRKKSKTRKSSRRSTSKKKHTTAHTVK